MALPKKKLGELLLDLGLIDRDQLTSALAYQRQWGHRLGASLVVKGFISEGTLVHVLSHSLSIPMVDLSQVQPQKEALKLIPPSTCEAQEIVPLAIEGARGRRTLVLAMSDPLNISVQEEVGFTTGCKVKPVIASSSSIQLAIRAWIRLERGISIPPVTYDKPRSGGEGPPSEEPMTLVQRGGEETVMRRPGTEAPQAAPPVAPAPAPFALAPPGSPALQPQPFAAAPGATLPPRPGPSGQFPVMTSNPAMVGPPSGSWPTQPPAPAAQYPQTAPYPAYQPPPAPPQAPPAPYPAAAAPQQAPVPGWPVPQEQMPLSVPVDMHEPVEELEKKFWALMRVLARKGLITKEEFLKELGNG